MTTWLREWGCGDVLLRKRQFTSCPAPGYCYALCPAELSRAAFLRRGMVHTERSTAAQSPAVTAALASHIVSSLSGISSLASHCHLPDLICSLTLCYHRMLKNLPNGSPALLLWSSGPRIPASIALCPRRHPTWLTASCHSYISAISLPQILPLPHSLWIG